MYAPASITNGDLMGRFVQRFRTTMTSLQAMYDVFHTPEEFARAVEDLVRVSDFESTKVYESVINHTSGGHLSGVMRAYRDTADLKLPKDLQKKVLSTIMAKKKEPSAGGASHAPEAGKKKNAWWHKKNTK